MPVIIKSSNIDFLVKIGVPPYIIDQMKFDGIKADLGVNTITFSLKSGTNLGKVVLPVKVATALKGVAGGMNVEPQVSKALLEVVFPKVGKLKSGSITEEELQEQFENEYIAAITPPLTSPLTPNPAPQVHPSVQTLVTSEPVLLRDATHMYQRVHGTSADNYYVVAMNKNVKLAVKINGYALSLRAEGLLTDLVRKALEKARLEYKQKVSGAYMSQHFTCNEEATVAHVLGALLSATELEFDTPFPSVSKLKELAGV